MHMVLTASVTGIHIANLQSSFKVVIKRQSFANIAERHAISSVCSFDSGTGIGQIDVELVLFAGETDRYCTGLTRRFDPVIDGVFEQGLQQQRRNQKIVGHIDDFPFDVQPVAEAQLLEVEVLPAESDFIGQGEQVAVITHQGPEEIGEFLESRFGPSRLCPDQ